MNRQQSNINGFCQSGFTLLEMVLVLFLLGLMASTTLMLSEGVEDQAKYDETKNRIMLIRKAVIGDSTRTINGNPEISGFVADVGRLPNDLRELTELAYCLTADFDDEATCTAAGKTWYEQPVYSIFYQCSDPIYLNETDCTTNGETWDPNQENMSVGWNGPYIQVNPERDGSLKLRDAYGNSGDDSEGDASDARNAGWSFTNTANTISYNSKGFNLTDAADDVVANDIIESDWIVNISSGMSAGFNKGLNLNSTKLPPISFCTDPSKTTKADCSSPATWYGGCNLAGYFNKSSCDVSGIWQTCSDGTSTDRLSCETASGSWYGEGYGCSSQQYTTKADCESNSATWRSCSDNGTITDKAVCEINNQIWHGANIFSIPLSRFQSKSICMKIFYRINETVAVVESDEFSVKENGSYQTVLFNGFSNTDIPVGINKVGIFEHDGTNCTDTFYPDNRINVIDVVFRARTQLGVINW